MPRIASGFKVRPRAGSPFFWVYATIPGLPPDGRLRKSTGISKRGDRAQAEREGAALYTAALNSIGGAGDGVALPAEVLSTLTLEKLCVDFIEQEEQDYKGHDDRHCDRFEADLVCHAQAHWTRVEEITTESWLKVREKLHKPTGPLKWRSIARLANTLRHFLRYCQSRGIIISVPEIKSPKTKLQRAEEAPRNALDEHQREAFLKALADLKELRAHRIYEVLFFSLLRQGELAALTPRWLNKKAETIRIPAGHTKSGEQEEIDLHPRALAAIEAEQKASKVVGADKPVFGVFDFHQAKLRWRKVNGKLVQVEDGGVFARTCRHAGLDLAGLTPHHVARHSAATIAGSREGVTLVELMAMGRWRSAQVAGKYLHPTVKAGRRASRKL